MYLKRTYRKPRSKNNYDMCRGCIAPNCDPFLTSPAFRYKIEKRRKAKLCPACGHKDCTCKRKGY